MQQDLLLALNDKIPLLPIAEVKELNGNVVCLLGYGVMVVTNSIAVSWCNWQHVRFWS